MCYHASVYISKPMTPTLNPSQLLFILHEDSFTETTTTTSPSHSLTTPRTPSSHPSPFAYVPTNKVVFTNPKDVVGPHWYNPMQIPSLSRRNCISPFTIGYPSLLLFDECLYHSQTDLGMNLDHGLRTRATTMTMGNSFWQGAHGFHCSCMNLTATSATSNFSTCSSCDENT